MRAYQLPKRTGIDDLTLVDLPTPKPGPNEVLIKVGACSLNFRDLAIVLGTYRAPVRENVIPLSDGAGEVTEAGPGVRRVQVGDRVAGVFFPQWFDGAVSAEHIREALGGNRDGMLAEYVVLHENAVVKLPAHLTVEEGATLPCAAVTVWNSLVELGRLTAGETVLIQGTGGVSIFALQFAKLMGAEVIATSSSDEKLARVKALGAAHGINYKTTPEWDNAVLDLTSGQGADHVVEVGGAGTLGRSLNAVRIGGRVSVIGVLTGRGQINPTPILSRRANVHGIAVGSVHMFEAMNRAIAAAKLKPVIDKVFEFGDAREAFRHLESGRHFGKIVVKVG
ncbi:MAG: NAD(P)-dependent alcohol dehydrogenase [Bradyrhizobiaceae bacterium]|nr:NAD(P)-dependent alcohol dehydrogenase [Bradyrhizobiaceae bacterium]